jgi:hypothetical protein
VTHPDAETLALIALGEAGHDRADHLGTCAACRNEVAALRRVVEIGRDSQDTRDLPPPPDAVWAGIAATAWPASRPRGERRRLAFPRSVRLPLPRPVRSALPGSVRLSLPRSVLTAALAAVVAVAVGIAGTLVVTRPDRTPSTARACGRVVYRADLAALPLAPSGATGEARVLCDGPDRRLHLHVSGLPLRAGYYEVWLIDPDSLEMTAVGQLGDSGDVLLPLASTTDLRKYRAVDVSAEQYDNNQAHSGESLLRGRLTT